MSRKPIKRWVLLLILVIALCAGGFVFWRWAGRSVEVETRLAPSEHVTMRSGLALTVPPGSERTTLLSTIHWHAAWLYVDHDTWTEMIVILPQVRPDVFMAALRSYPCAPTQALEDLRNTLWFPGSPPQQQATSPDGNVSLYWDTGSNEAVVVTRLPGKETGVIMVKSFASSRDHIASVADVNKAFATLWEDYSVGGAAVPVLAGN